MAGTGTEFEFYDSQTNESFAFRGTIDGHESQIIRVLTSETSSNDTMTTSTSRDTRTYDGRGALWFVVTVILIYGMSMFMIIVTLARRKSAHKNMDVEVDRYMKGLEGARKRAREESVLRMRLQWPGNYIGQRFTNRPEHDLAGSRDCIGSDGEEDCSNTDESSGSYVELPATTVGSSNAGAGGNVGTTSEGQKDAKAKTVLNPGRPRRTEALFVHAEDIILPTSVRPALETTGETPARCRVDKEHSPEGASVPHQANGGDTVLV